jgi:hypothetical protein
MRELPDTNNWLPRDDKTNALKNTFLQTCRSIQARIIAESNIERDFNIDNFDSGPGVEDLCKNQIQLLLPTRYEAMSGVISDQTGRTCGECDIVIVNKQWFPLIKYGATKESRRIHIPVEAVYSVVEVKQTLTLSSLEEAMKKIVTYKRLNRIRSEYGRVVENHNLKMLENTSKSLNYRYDTIIMINSKEDDHKELVKRFFLINETLPCCDRVNSLAILDYGYACYVTKKDSITAKKLYPEHDDAKYNAFFLTTPTDTFFRLWTDIWSHLTLSVLNVEAMGMAYGSDADCVGTIFNLNSE